MISIFDRIEYLRKGRAHHTWLGSLGIARDTIKHIKDKTAEPSENVLSIISKCENASFLWLTEGEGAPYRVAQFENDGECAEALADYLAEEAWVAYVVNDSQRNTIVLAMESNFQRARSGFVEFIAIEVLTQAGIKAVSEAAMHASAFRVVEVDTECMDNIIDGKVGTYDLLGDSKSEGILSHADLVSMNERLTKHALPHSLPDTVSEKPGAYPLHLRLDSVEYEFLRLYRQLDEEGKQLMFQMVKKMK